MSADSGDLSIDEAAKHQPDEFDPVEASAQAGGAENGGLL
jgi:hypothetical protein